MGSTTSVFPVGRPHSIIAGFKPAPYLLLHVEQHVEHVVRHQGAGQPAPTVEGAAEGGGHLLPDGRHLCCCAHVRHVTGLQPTVEGRCEWKGVHMQASLGGKAGGQAWAWAQGLNLSPPLIEASRAGQTMWAVRRPHATSKRAKGAWGPPTQLPAARQGGRPPDAGESNARGAQLGPAHARA